MDPFMSYRTGGRCRGQKPQYESCDFVGLIIRVGTHHQHGTSSSFSKILTS